MAASSANSASAFDAPITVAGATALSVETSTKRPTPCSPATCATTLVAIALLRTASTGLASIRPDVLVGGGVEDDRRPVLGEDLAHALLLLAVREHGGEHRGRYVALVLELALDREEVVLGVVEQHDPVRLHAGDLAAQLRADRAAGAGHEHGLPGEVGADALELHLHRLAAEHVLDAHLAHLAGERAASLEQLEHGRQRAHGYPARAALAHDSRARRARGGGDRDDHFVGLGLVEDARQVAFGVPAHAHAVDAQPPLARVVVEEADRREPELAVAHDLAQHQPPAVAGTGDQHAAFALAPSAEGRQRTALVDAARERPHADQEHQRQQGEQHDDAVGQADRRRCRGAWPRSTGTQHGDGDDREQHDREDRPRDRLVVALARVAPAALVDAREDEHGQAPRKHPPDRAFAQQRVVAGRARCRSAAGRRGSTRARPAPRPPRVGAASAGGGEGPPSGSVGAFAGL